jgi:hypothetical protein
VKNQRDRNYATRAGAINRYRLWTPEEEAIVMQPGFTQVQLAKLLGRTMSAVNGRLLILRSKGRTADEGIGKQRGGHR